jgi:hypothetical protein
LASDRENDRFEKSALQENHMPFARLKSARFLRRPVQLAILLFPLSLSLAGCGPDGSPAIQAGLTASASTSPSASASPLAGASPSASASPSPLASPSVTASAAPQSSASPGVSPTVSPIASATPSVIFGATASPGMPLTSLTFHAQIVTTSHQVLPVAKADFKALPYNLAQVQQDLISRNGPGPKPVEPLQSDLKYQQIEKDCNASGCTTQLTVNIDAYREDLQNYQSNLLPDWEKLAYKGLDDAISTASQGRTELDFVTDANGGAALQLAAGTWYFSGRYTNGSTITVWDAIPFTITAATQSIELTR